MYNILHSQQWFLLISLYNILSKLQDQLPVSKNCKTDNLVTLVVLTKLKSSISNLSQKSPGYTWPHNGSWQLNDQQISQRVYHSDLVCHISSFFLCFARIPGSSKDFEDQTPGKFHFSFFFFKSFSKACFIYSVLI